jgi:CxxC motif-containing protein (DUF1111 family)
MSIEPRKSGTAHRIGITALPLLFGVAALGCGASEGASGAVDPSLPAAGGAGAASGTSSDSGESTPSGHVGGAASGGAPPAGEASLGGIVPLFDGTAELEPAVVEDTPTRLITRWSDRARDRHARESQFRAYEHYLHLYWEHRTAEVEIIDTVGRGGDSVVFNVKTSWKLDDEQAELRFFFRGIGTVAEYHDNRPMTPVGDDGLHYTRAVKTKLPEGRPLQVGDKMEFELSQFLDKNFNGRVLAGRDNYYGTTMLYIVGKGLVPWIGSGERRDSNPVPEHALLGGMTSVHAIESDEPREAFLQLAGNMAAQNGQRFVLGRRVVHTSFADGSHDESSLNPIWSEQAGKLGPLYINHSCNACHFQNGRAVPPEPGVPLEQYVIKLGDAQGAPLPDLGAVLQPGGGGEPGVSIARWIEQDGLRRPEFEFEGMAPAHFSARVAPQLVGMGLLEAIPEHAIVALADPEDRDGDGISGRVRRVQDPVTGEMRLGRFGWKAGQATVKHQVAAALRSDMGVLTSVFQAPDCGEAQQNCGAAQVELGDTELDQLTLYMALLGMRPQRDWDAPEVVQGREVFSTIGCASCHTPNFTTSEFAHHAELRSQEIQPFTDLLLHDMGEGLADTLIEGDATYTEWRTPPLWGIGLGAAVSGGESYLHDGRARTLSEAILWHGGEGERSKRAFAALPESEKQALLAFLKSL